MKQNYYLKYFFGFLFFFILSAGCSIPFFYESPSIFYKTGLDKLMLRSGKIFGIIAILLMIFQLLFIGKFKVLSGIFGTKLLFQFHRLNGLILMVIALIHPVLILGADHFVFFPIELKYWPEFIGGILFVYLIPFVGVANWQKKLPIEYKTWKEIHKWSAPLLFILGFTHVLNVSRSFESGLPFYALITLGISTIFFIVRKFIS